MNILDLKKGDNVFVGVHRAGGCATECEYVEKMEVRSIFAYMRGQYAYVRLSDGNMVRELGGEYGETINCYLSKDDFFDDVPMEVPRQSAFVKYITEREGYEVHNDLYPIVWKWDESSKKAYQSHIKPNNDEWGVNGKVNIFTYRFPDGCYPTKEACEKANKRMVTIEVTRTFMTQREEGADAEWLLNNPDEYEFQDGDECISDAQYAG